MIKPSYQLKALRKALPFLVKRLQQMSHFQRQRALQKQSG